MITARISTETRFGALYGEQTAREQAEFMSEERDFDALSERVHHFRGYLFLVLSEPPEATFPIARYCFSLSLQFNVVLNIINVKSIQYIFVILAAKHAEINVPLEIIRDS